MEEWIIIGIKIELNQMNAREHLFVYQCLSVFQLFSLL